MNATGCHLPLGWWCDKTPPRANPEASTLIWKVPVGNGCAMTGSDATSAFMLNDVIEGFLLLWSPLESCVS
jgi:hypothetical protein